MRGESAWNNRFVISHFAKNLLPKWPKTKNAINFFFQNTGATFQYLTFNQGSVF